MAEKCYIFWQGNLKREKIDYKLYGVSIGKLDAEMYDKCGELFLMKILQKG